MQVLCRPNCELCLEQNEQTFAKGGDQAILFRRSYRPLGRGAAKIQRRLVRAREEPQNYDDLDVPANLSTKRPDHA